MSLKEFRDCYHAVLAEWFPSRLDRLFWTGRQLAEHQRSRLRTLLAHVRENSPFYARRLAAIDVEWFELEQLQELPVLTKMQMMHQLDEIFTDSRLTRTSVEEALATTGAEPALLPGGYIAQVSGGSTAVRGLFVSNLDSMVDSALSVLRETSRLSIPTAGEELRIAMVAAESCIHATGLVAAMNPPDSGAAAIYSVPATLQLAEIVRRVEDIEPHVLSGYPTMLARLARERSAGRLKTDPVRIQSTSEMLTPQLRRAISTGFAAPIVDVFGCSEGLMGVTTPDDVVFTFNSDMVITELVDERYRPVSPGATSSAVLLTNLTNLTQPLIRYALTDRFKHAPSDGSALLRATVDGRHVDLFQYGDVTVHPFALSSVLLRKTDLIDHQVLQTLRGVKVLFTADHDVETEAIVGDLTRALITAGLTVPEVVLTRVGQLTRYRDSSKLRRYIPLTD